jgi:hypothetical protein
METTGIVWDRIRWHRPFQRDKRVHRYCKSRHREDPNFGAPPPVFIPDHEWIQYHIGDEWSHKLPVTYLLREDVNSVNKFPDELVLRILSHLELPFMCRCRRVSPQFYRVGSDSSLWPEGKRQVAIDKYIHQLKWSFRTWLERQGLMYLFS